MESTKLTKDILISRGFIRSDMFSDDIIEAFYIPNEPYLLISPAKITTVVAPTRNYVNFWLQTVEELDIILKLLKIDKK
jgi:hypothetical protein